MPFAGYLKWKHIGFRPPQAWDLSLASREGLTVFHAASVLLQSFSLSNLTIKISSPHLNFLTQPDGRLHLVALLQVGS